MRLLVARNGDLWITYLLSEKFVTYRNGKLHVVPSPPTNGEVVDLAETPDGTIWAAIGQAGQPIMRYRQGKWTRVDPTGVAGKAATISSSRPDGALWASYNDSIYRLPPALPASNCWSATRGRGCGSCSTAPAGSG